MRYSEMDALPDHVPTVVAMEYSRHIRRQKRLGLHMENVRALLWQRDGRHRM